MEKEISLYLHSLELQNYSQSTLKQTDIILTKLAKFLQRHNKFNAVDVVESDLLNFVLEVKNRKSQFTGESLASATVSFYVSYIRNFFKFLKEKDFIYSDPAAKLRFPRRGAKLPRSFFTEEEIESILRVIDVNDKFGIRDRALLELLYSTGMRSQEILFLAVNDVDFSKELVFVENGKGNKERLVPAGKRALFWVEYYIENSNGRKKILRGKERSSLFVSLHGTPMKNYHLNQRINTYKAKAGISKIGGAHSFRHSCATHMLRHGADIRYVQELLGHDRISTTTVYTRVSLNHLKEAYHKVLS